jgi:hypothetical protein
MVRLIVLNRGGRQPWTAYVSGPKCGRLTGNRRLPFWELPIPPLTGRQEITPIRSQHKQTDTMGRSQGSDCTRGRERQQRTPVGEGAQASAAMPLAILIDTTTRLTLLAPG